MFATSDLSAGFVIMSLIIFGVCFKIWLVIFRPGVYTAELANEQRRREQRNQLLGGGLKVLGTFFGLRK
jgi:hypothetical protein